MGLEERASTMIGVSTAYLVIAWIAFSLRVVVKGYIMRSFALDDWLMVIAMVRIEDSDTLKISRLICSQLIFTVDSSLLIVIGRDLKDVQMATIYVTVRCSISDCNRMLY